MRGTLRGALLSVLFFGGLLLFSLPATAQGGGGSDPCEGVEGDCMTVTAEDPAGNPGEPTCYMDCLQGPNAQWPSGNSYPGLLNQGPLYDVNKYGPFTPTQAPTPMGEEAAEALAVLYCQGARAAMWVAGLTSLVVPEPLSRWFGAGSLTAAAAVEMCEAMGFL